MEQIDSAIARGIEDGRRAFYGPRIVQIDLTGRCNNNCIGCWIHSPYIKNPPRDKNKTLSFGRVKEIVKDLVRMGTKEIYLSGAGEPFLHPNILEIVELVKSNHLKLNLITNFSLVDEKKARFLADAEVDMLTVSIWAGTAKAYMRTHPNKTEEDFYRIRENLKRLSGLKMKSAYSLPKIKIYNVICNQNYQEISAMVNLAIEVGAEFVEFQIMDIIENETSILALTQNQVDEIKRQLEYLKEHKDLRFKGINALCAQAEKELSEFPGWFCRLPEGFSLKELIKKDDSGQVSARYFLDCPKGQETRPSCDNPLFEEDKNRATFSFQKEKCSSCQLFGSGCPVDVHGGIALKLTRISSFGTFLRRLNSDNVYKQIYEEDLINGLPCYIGWTYSRILSTGEVIPCCKSSKKAVGNIKNRRLFFLKGRFIDIWNSQAYQRFRYSARSLPKSHPYFRKINCFKSCDNVGMNLQTKELMSDEIKLCIGETNSISLKDPEGRYSLQSAATKVPVSAARYRSGNMNPQEHNFGSGMVIDGGKGFNFAEYEVNFPESGDYQLWSYYASGQYRPVNLYFDGRLILEGGLHCKTGGWSNRSLRWFKETPLYVEKGRHILKLEAKGLIPHLYSFAFLLGVQNLPISTAKVLVHAAHFKSGNINPHEHNFGSGMVIDGGKGFNFAEYEVNFPESGDYQLWSYYASAQSRPVNLYFDGTLILEGGMDSKTGGWSSRFLYWFKEISFHCEKGRHILRLEAKGLIPHLHSFAFLSGVHSNLDETAALAYEKIYSQPSPLALLKDRFRQFGFLASLGKLYRYVVSSRLIDNYLDIVGIFHGTHAFKGPFHVQIDLTNDCNNNCIGCWCNSPLLEEKILPPEVKRQTMSFGMVRELLDELAFLGTKEIYFSGGGEPFMHPEIMEILAYAKRKGFNCCVNTNFTLLNKEKIRQLIDIGVDHLNVSTWAGNAKTYAATHPNKSKETFLEMIENLKFLNHTKRKKPHIKLYNVIFNMNYRELKEMIALAKETNSESAEFTLIDTMPGKTDKLLLNAGQIKELQASAREVSRYVDSRGYFDGVLLFRFDSFLRRISSASDLSKATYDRNIIDKMPCYIGWCFSRVIPNGDVHACLKAHRIPTGNLFESSFRQIWNGAKQRHFRKKTHVCVKSDPFFRLIGNDPAIKEAGCYKSCDDIGRNTHIHNRIMSLSLFERAILRLASRLKRSTTLRPESKKLMKDPLTSGIQDGRRAFCGPEQVVIDITNRCNLRCVGCWFYSPHLKNKPDSAFLNQEIDFTKAKDLITGLAKLGTKRIRFTGGGEPFLYPKMMELIALAKEKGLITCVTTNFSLLDKQKIDELIRLELDELAASLWAGNKETYQKLRPASPDFLFEKIKENLLYLNRKKKERPFVTLCNVICNLNYDELKEMFDFAVDSQSDAVYFTLIDALEGTDTLLLDAEQRRRVLEEAEKACSAWEKLTSSKRPKLDYFDGFIARLKEESAGSGDYDRQRINKVPCYVGWTFARIVADGEISCCCRGVKKPMGNINRQDFEEVWFSPKYNEFRAKAKYLPKTETYFSEIGCLKMCDNLMHNEEMHKRIRPLV